MNIFFLDENPKECAKMHCDKHCVKMILETAQLLCTAHWSTGSKAPYRATHKNHPSAIWTRKSLENYLWLVHLGIALCEEYTMRYNKTHKTQKIIAWCAVNLPPLPNKLFTPPPQCMPRACMLEDAIQAYRNYYITEKKSIAQWNHSKIPEWFKGKNK